MKLRARLVGSLWRWHRRAGLLAALLLLFLAVTGLLLNHAADLGLDTRRVEAGWLRALYEGEPTPLRAWPVGPRWIAQGEDHALFLDEHSLGGCDGRLVGARAWKDVLVVACEHELVLLTAQGERIDALGRASGLDARLDGLGSGDAGLRVRANGSWRSFDTEDMALGAEAEAAALATPADPPAELAARIHAASSWLSWERALLDLHSGRAFGRFGMLAIDLAGVLSIALALSGVMIWSLRRRARRS